MPLISVVIPAYNAEKTIKNTVDSVLHQTFSDFELIVINDGSQDSTLAIVSSIPDPRIRVFSYSNSGPQKSRNRGISQSTGEYVSFIDADDLWTPDKLEAQLKALQENSKAGVAYSWTDYIDAESGQVLPQGPHANFAGNVFATLLLADFIGSGSNPLILKQALVEVGGFDESLVAGQDWDMWLRLAHRYHFAVVPSVQVLYRVSANSWSSNLERREAGFRRVIEKAIAQAPDSLKLIKKDIISNRYKCLTIDALQGYPERKRGLLAAKFLLIAVRNDLMSLRRRATWQVLLKIAIVVLFPPKKAHFLLNKHKIKRLSNLDSFLLHLRLEPF